MFRLPNLLFAAALLTSAAAFAADTPDPSSTGPAAAPSGSNVNTPPNPAVTNSPNINKSESDKSAVETSPGEENKGKPKVEQ
jgi:hypothetical protein